MDTLKKAVFLAGLVLFCIWFWPNIQMLTGDNDGTIRLVLAGFFSLIILVRLKPRTSRSLGGTPGIVAAGILGATLAVAGLMFTVHQFEWLGIILVLYACLRWSLPDRWSADIVRSMFLLYWIHPLPGRLFGWFEILMQKLSVIGSEWMLHMLNVRVWADGIYLRTGHHIFGVPEACSGMRTAVTMLICILGVSLLFKQRWWETLVFMVLGSAQVLLLNIVRITFMVMWAERMPREWSETFLHDSLGFFLLAAIFLVQAEMSWWKIRMLKASKRKEQLANEEIEEPDMANALPRIWYLVLKSAKWVILAVLVMLGGAFALYKHRPYHRAAMISDVVDGLMETDAAAAESAVNHALGYLPGARELLDKKAHVLILRKKYGEVLDTIEKIAPPLNTFETVMKSWALMSLKRPEEAIALIKALPQSEQAIPGVAIVRAEYAMIMDDVADTARNVLLAAGSAFTTERIREIYPYLAAHEQWKVIAGSNNFNVPYDDVVSALIVIQAYIRERDLPAASRVLDMALQKWPEHPGLLKALYFMAMKNPGSKWEELFAENFRANVKSFNADDTSERINMAFRLGRPDLGWLAYRRLESLDPSDPDLFIAPARYGGVWFVFDRSQIGVKIRDDKRTLNLGPFIELTGSSTFFGQYWDRIPLSRELLGRDRDSFRAKMLDKGLKEIEARIAAGDVSKRMEADYPAALGLAGRFADAHKYLETLAVKYPDRASDMMMQHAELYHAENRWQESYEQLRQYMSLNEDASLADQLMLVDDLMNMNQGVYALDVLMHAKEHFPGIRELALAESSIWNVFGFKDMALHLLEETGDNAVSYTRAQLLFETGRYREAARLAKVLGMKPFDTEGTAQRIALPPAELTVENRWPKPLNQDELKERFSKLAQARKGLTSPFLSKMAEQEAVFLRDGTVSFDAWSECGRDPREKAAALHRLTILAGRQQRFAEAKEAAEAAVKQVPASPVLWRILIALSKGDRAAVEEAVKHCPDDPEIWLASLVSSPYSKDDDEALELEIKTVMAKGVFPVETYIRAADFLIRKRQFRAAFYLADEVAKKEQGLLAADMLVLRCALIRKDLETALSSALKGVQDSLDPVPFYKMIVALKSAGKMADIELVQALENLREAYPEDRKWSEDLGMVYFEKGDTARALSVLNTLIKQDVRNVTARSFILAAESARLEGETDTAVDILRAARALYPEKDIVLNNFVYSMAQDPATLDEALELLPELNKIEDKTFHVYDTMAQVCMKNGRLEEARKYMDKALELIDSSQYSANEVKLNSAELMLKMGEIRGARALVEEVQGDKGRTDQIDRRAMRLLKSIRESR